MSKAKTNKKYEVNINLVVDEKNYSSFSIALRHFYSSMPKYAVVNEEITELKLKKVREFSCVFITENFELKKDTYTLKDNNLIIDKGKSSEHILMADMSEDEQRDYNIIVGKIKEDIENINGDIHSISEITENKEVIIYS